MFRRFAYMIEKNFELKRSFDNNKDITKDDITAYIKQGATIIDVRSPQEFKEGHIDGAICIPDYQIKKEIARQISNKNKLIVLYCSTGHRSQKAQQTLENMGYTNVYNVYEGILLWFLNLYVKIRKKMVKKVCPYWPKQEEKWITDKNTLEILV